MRDDSATRLRRAADEFGRAASLPRPQAIRARGDRRRRNRALGSALLALVLVVGGGTAYLTVGTAPQLHQPAGKPTPGPSRSAPGPTTSPSTSPAAMLPAGQVGPRSAVPWAQVGPGWVLAEYSGQATTPNATLRATTLYLVDPEGGRYTMYRWPAGTLPQSLIDWSGDKTRALFLGPQGPSAMAQLTLSSGLMANFNLAQPGQFVPHPAGYTRPEGTNLLAIGGPSSGTSLKLDRLERFGLTGALQATLATGKFNGNPADSPDGTIVAVGTGRGVQLVSNAGGSSRLVPVPGVNPRVGCSTVRWWDSTTVLASCMPSSSPRSQLWLVPTGAGAPTALTQVRPTGSQDLGDSDAWQLPSGLYLQASGAGCSEPIFRQAADGSITQLTGPNTGAGAAILAVVDGRMLLQAKSGCSRYTQSLLWYDPATGATQQLLSAPSSGEGVITAIPYGGRNG